jgi:hypothetical protein
MGILPAIIYDDGEKFWFKNGLQHRDDKDPYTGLILPAVIRSNGKKEWYKDGKRFNPKRIKLK